MRERLLAMAVLAASAAVAQLQLSVLIAGTEQPMRPVLGLGTVENGGALETTFRIRNPGLTGISLDKLSVAGTGFTLRGAPQLPLTLMAGAVVEFAVRLEPTVVNGQSAVLSLNAETFWLMANAVPGPLMVADSGGTRITLGADSLVDFGEAALGAEVRRRFTVSNPNPQAIEIWQLGVAGDAFSFVAGGASAPLRLPPGESSAIEVNFRPAVEGIAEGSLQLNTRRIRLRGAAVAPPAPKPAIVLDPAAPRSGEQVRLVVRLESATRAATAGQLSLEFRGPEDNAIAFLAPVGRLAAFEVPAGEDTARFGSAGEIWFQTGSTAGTLVLTVRFGPHLEQAVLPLAPLPVKLDSLKATRAADGIEVEVTGFDNTRSASSAEFTFLDRDSRVLGGGPLRVDLGADFQRFFASSGAGGMFALRAIFPVKGDAAGIAEVQLELANQSGAARKSVKM